MTPEATGGRRPGAIRELLSASSIYALAIIAQRVASILLTPIYTRVLNPSDYAITELLDLTLSLIGMVLGGQFASALFYFHSRAATEEERNATASTVLLGTFVLGFLAGGVGFVAAPALSKLVFETGQYAHYFRIAAVSLGMTFPFEACLNWLRAIHKPRFFVAASILRLCLAIVLTVVLLLGFKMKVAGVLWSTLISVTVTTAVLCVYCWMRIPIRFDVDLFWRLLRYSAPIGGFSLSMFVIHFGDRFILQRFAGLDNLGIYSLAYKLSMSVGLVQQAFNSYWSAQFYSVLGSADGRRIFARVFTYIMFAMSAAGALIIVAAPALVRLIAAPSYYPAAAMVPWLVAIYVVRAAADHIRAIFYTEKKTGTDAALAVISGCICLTGYFLLIPPFKSYGAIAATGLGFFSLLSLGYWRAQRLWPFYLEGARIAKLAAAFTVTVVLSMLLSLRQPSLPLQVAGAAVCLAVYAALIKLLGFVTSDELERLVELYREGRKRLRPA